MRRVANRSLRDILLIGKELEIRFKSKIECSKYLKLIKFSITILMTKFEQIK